MSAKISVVIPMYNAAQYITHCVDALLRQTVGDIEVVVVDDCSTDEGFLLCTEKYAGNDNVKILKQPKNMGPGAARNTGIAAATGEYVTFVDSDDAILADAFAKMYAAAKETDADVLHVGGALIPFAKELPDDLSGMTEKERIPFLLDGKEATKVTVLSEDMRIRMDEWLTHAHHWNIWSKLYRRTFLLEHKITFTDLSLSEDQNFAFHCLLHAKNYVKMPGFFYLYRISGESLSRGKKDLAFMAKLLRTTFALSKCMDDTMDTHPFFAEHPEYREKVKAFCLAFLENGYTKDCYRMLSRADMENDAAIRDIFVRHFGSNAGYVAKQFYDAHDALPAPEGEAPDMNSYEFWAAMVAKFGEGAVIKIGG